MQKPKRKRLVNRLSQTQHHSPKFRYKLPNVTLRGRDPILGFLTQDLGFFVLTLGYWVFLIKLSKSWVFFCICAFSCKNDQDFVLLVLII